MHEAEQVSSLIGDIYDAALDPSLWPAVLQDLTGFIGGCAGSLFWRDSVHLTGNAYYAYGTDDHYKRIYFDTYIRFDPLNAAYLCIGIGEVVSSSKLIPHTDFVETRFYKEWVRPQGLIDNILTVVEKSSTGVACCCVFRHERDGFADDEARRRMRLLNAHVRRAVLISKLMVVSCAATPAKRRATSP